MKRRHLTPPLKAMSTRIRLLAWSYEDAAIGSNDGGRGSKPQSRALSRNPELWNHGAYAQFERTMHRLRRVDNRAFRELEALHIGRSWQRQPEGNHVIDLFANLAPYCEWHVPAAISEAAGCAFYEAKEWQLRCLNPECRVCRKVSAGALEVVA